LCHYSHLGRSTRPQGWRPGADNHQIDRGIDRQTVRSLAMHGYRFVAIILVLAAGFPALAAEKKQLSPVEARKKVGKAVTVRMEVKAAKDRLEKRGEIYLDAEEDFKDEKNIAVVITRKGAESLRKAGVADPADSYKGKTIQATG